MPPEILAELPDLEEEDVAEALRYAAEAVREGELPQRPADRSDRPMRPVALAAIDQSPRRSATNPLDGFRSRRQQSTARGLLR